MSNRMIVASNTGNHILEQAASFTRNVVSLRDVLLPLPTY